MGMLLEPARVGRLALRNRTMRSATVESMADPLTGRPLSVLGTLYRDLAEGQVGLIVTGHLCVTAEGRTSPGMASLVSGDLVPIWREVIAPAKRQGARVMAQINHGGAVVGDLQPVALSPSGIARRNSRRHRAMTSAEVESTIRAFGAAAIRAQQAGFDGVQVHAAHGYLGTQYLSPAYNLRTDRWSGCLGNRMAFVKATLAEVRGAVGPSFPVWVKLGVAGDAASGLTVAEGAEAAASCFESDADCVEISHGAGVPVGVDPRVDAAYLSLAQVVRERVGAEGDLALVAGFSSMAAMNEVLDTGVVQMISLCRPIIAEPELVSKLATGASEALCVRCDRCRASMGDGGGLRCLNPRVRRLAGRPMADA